MTITSAQLWKTKRKPFHWLSNETVFKVLFIACHLPYNFFLHFETIIVTTIAQFHNLNECRICKRTAIHKEFKKGRNLYMWKRFVAIALLFLLTNTSKNCYAKEVSTLKFELKADKIISITLSGLNDAVINIPLSIQNFEQPQVFFFFRRLLFFKSLSKSKWKWSKFFNHFKTI